MHMPSGIDNVSVVFRERNFTPECEARVRERIIKDLRRTTSRSNAGMHWSWSSAKASTTRSAWYAKATGIGGGPCQYRDDESGLVGNQHDVWR